MLSTGKLYMIYTPQIIYTGRLLPNNLNKINN